MKKAVLIGAGQFGRGVIGMLLEQSGYHVVFADVNEAVIRDINERGEYKVRRIDRHDSTVTVKNISAISSLSPALVEECAACDVLCTCTGLTALPKVAPAIAESISRRIAQGFEGFLNVLACENALGGSTILKKYVLSHLQEKEQEYLEKHIGFPDCAIDGIIPPVKNALPADVTAEEYFEWDSLKSGFRGELPEIRGLHIVEDLSRYLERKIFTLNGPNAVTGCFGWRKGYRTVQESLEDPEIYHTVWQMMEEAGAMLSARHGYTAEEMLEYRTFIMNRFKNVHIIDTCERVSREPLRKLASDDRIVAAMNYAHSFGISTPAYYKGIAEVLCYDNPNDEQSIEMQQMIRSLGMKNALEKISGIPADSETASFVEAEYEKIAEKQV
ncbi:MAG: mannitol-1-phosphate 5-dehydrogenase [Oscillospiraceae bacterium]|nr:mannitol-1-phosphate 5-dehydrogenase [Oscillospiraceae bacterium]